MKPMTQGVALCVYALALLFVPFSTSAETVTDNFEKTTPLGFNTNPNNWAWANIFDALTVTPQGGNPGAWADTGLLYFAAHPNFTALPPPGSKLRTALESADLRSASIDIQRLDTTDVQGCNPTHLQDSFIALTLVDEHSGDFSIEGRTTFGASFPLGPFPWQTASFVIPSDATDTPPGWELVNNNDNLPDYSWADLMHNLDAIGFYVGNPDQHAFSACSHLGADNAIVTYGDSIFPDGFEVPNAGGPAQ